MFWLTLSMDGDMVLYNIKFEINNKVSYLKHITESKTVIRLI